MNRLTKERKRTQTRPVLAAFIFLQSSGTQLLVTDLALSQSSALRTQLLSATIAFHSPLAHGCLWQISLHIVAFAPVRLAWRLLYTVAFGNIRLSTASTAGCSGSVCSFFRHTVVRGSSRPFCNLLACGICRRILSLSAASYSLPT